MINVLPIRGGSCQLCPRQGPLAGVVAVLSLLMCLERQEVGVTAGRMKDGTQREQVSEPLLSVYADFAMRQWRGERRQRMCGFQFETKCIYGIYRVPTEC